MLEKRLLKFIRENKRYYAAMVFHGLSSLIFSILTALFFSNVVNTIFIKKGTLNETAIDFYGLLFVILFRAAATFFFQRYFRITAGREKNHILLTAVRRLLKKGPVDSKQEGSGGLVTSWIEASDKIEPYFAEYLPQFFTLVITAPFLVLAAATRDWISALIMLITGPLLPFFLSLIGMSSRDANQKRLKSLAELGDGMLDFLNGIRTLKIFQGEESYRDIIARYSEEFRISTMQVLRIAFLSAFVLELAATISTAMIAVMLGVRLMYGKMEFHAAFFILLIIPDYYMAIRKFGAKFHTALGAKAAADLLLPDSTPETEASVKEVLTPRTATERVHISIENLTYIYPGTERRALDQINMEIPAGRLTAVVGVSGSGKSTLAYALMGYICGEGEIHTTVDAESGTRNLTALERRKMISYIPQKPYIFHDTLRNNLLHANQEATKEQIEKAIELSSLSEFVEHLPHGLDTLMTEAGSNVSIGEAQRIAFARAALKDTPVVLLDEITSALDQENEKVIQDSFHRLSEDKTVLVIAHRLETVKQADCIYVLSEGRVAESGTHASLLAANGHYRRLIQAWEEEQ